MSETVFAQPTDQCTNYSGNGILVSDQCEPRGLNIEPSYVSNLSGSGYSCSVNTSRKDAYWWFEATSTETIITYYPTGGNVTAGLYNPILTVFTGNSNCSGNNMNGNVLACANNRGNGELETLVITTVIGQKYRIRIQNAESNNNAVMYGQICIVNKKPFGDTPCSAVELPVDSLQKSSWFTTVGADYTTRVNGGSGNNIPAPGCGTWDSNREDIWFKLTMPTADLVIDTEPNGSGSMSNSTMAVYKATGSSCGTLNLTLVACDTDSGFGSMSKIHVENGTGSGQVLSGTPLYVRVWAENSNNSNNGLFGIGAYVATTCGNPIGLKNDFCESPAVMYKDPNTSFSASTAGVFTTDIFSPQTPNWGCTGGMSTIYVHNNSWYQFTAETATEVFPFSASCTGVQAVILEVSYTGRGCCNNFTRKSNCISNMAEGTNAGTITATGLTIGREYILMVDGYAGSRCDFTIRGWNALNILLGIELSSFSAIEKENHNVIKWTTDSEINNDFFTILRSYDGESWANIGIVNGAGNSKKRINYELEDSEVRAGVVYYKLMQTDYDGKSTTGNIITVIRKSNLSGIVTLAPNPAQDEVIINILSDQDGGRLQIATINGQIIYETDIQSKGVHSIRYDLSQVEKGLYLVTYTDSLTTSVKQLVKR